MLGLFYHRLIAKFRSFCGCLTSGSLTNNLSVEGFHYKDWVLKVLTGLHSDRLELFLVGSLLARYVKCCFPKSSL